MSLKVGTVETTPDENEREKRKRAGLSGGGSSNGGGGRRRGGGGGGDNDNGGGDNLGGDDRNFHEIEEFRPDKLRIAMWFTLLIVLMTFGGLLAAYVALSTNKSLEWQPFALPFQMWVSTALIIASSVCYKIAQNKLQSGHQETSKNWLLATAALGGVFIASQLLLWLQLVRGGVYVRSNPYAGFFYILTAVHAVHVLVGVGALGYILLRTWQPTGSETELLRRKITATVVGWYWHFMDALWIVLVLLLGFYK